MSIHSDSHSTIRHVQTLYFIYCITAYIASERYGCIYLNNTAGPSSFRKTKMSLSEYRIACIASISLRVLHISYCVYCIYCIYVKDTVCMSYCVYCISYCVYCVFYSMYIYLILRVLHIVLRVLHIVLRVLHIL